MDFPSDLCARTIILGHYQIPCYRPSEEPTHSPSPHVTLKVRSLFSLLMRTRAGPLLVEGVSSEDWIDTVKHSVYSRHEVVVPFFRCDYWCFSCLYCVYGVILFLLKHSFWPRTSNLKQIKDVWPWVYFYTGALCPNYCCFYCYFSNRASELMRAIEQPVPTSLLDSMHMFALQVLLHYCTSEDTEGSLASSSLLVGLCG